MRVLTIIVSLCTGAVCIESNISSSASPVTSTTQNLSLVNDLNTTYLNNDYQCYEPALFKDRRARAIDCIRAAAFLPNLHEAKLFHRGSNPDDPYALPNVTTVGTCRITIDVKFGRADESTWVVINMAVRKIIDACRLTLTAECTGGQTTAGTEGRIIITAENKKWRTPNVASARRLGR